MDADAELDCRRASRLLSLACERELDANEAAALAHHLSECLMCTNFKGQLEFLRRAASAYRRDE
jgi:hypothetical protein